MISALLIGLATPYAQDPPQVEQRAPSTVEYTLEIAHEAAPTPPRGRPGLSINGTIPGPTLRFREGDRARVVVKNLLGDEEASIHWHGLLLPNAMDGVPYLTTAPIPARGQHTFEFDLRQSGTYWYHSHTSLQEQAGIYGAIVIEPREGLTALHAELGVDRELVMVVSDWTDEDPDEVMRTLMRGSDWYAIKKGNAQSIVGAWRQGKLGEYFARERLRMPPMDISDIAYDHFLVNGVDEARFDEAKPGERILVRIVNAAAATYFHITSAAGPLQIVAADGLRVQPVDVRRLLMGIAETYDVVVTMPADGDAIELRATAHDRTGHGALVLGAADADVLRAEDPPPPEIYGMDEMLRAGLSSVSQSKGEAAATDERPFAPYALLRTLEPSEISREAEARGVRTISMRLTGDMERFIWSINGKTLAEDPVVKISSDEVVRIEFVNDTMMHHPMHLHGHFFRVVTAAGAYSPVKHTVDVPPMGRRTIEFVANEEPGDWFLHCHILYHMDAGMARVISYDEQGEEHTPSIDPKLIEPSFLFFDAAFMTHMAMGHAKWMKGREDFFVRGHGGYRNDGEGMDHMSSDGGNDKEREIDVGWSHYVDPNLSTVLGYRFTNEGNGEDRFFGGVRYRLPYMVHTSLTADDELDVRVELEKSLQITARGALFGAVEYDTNTYSDWSTGVTWTLLKQVGLIAQYDSDHGFGAGVTISL